MQTWPNKLLTIFLLACLAEATSCASFSKTDSSRIGPGSRDSFNCGQVFQKRISNALKDISVNEFHSLNDEEKRVHLASKVYSLLPDPERDALSASYSREDSLNGDERILIGNLQNAFAKENLCKTSQPELDAYIFGDQLTQFLYQMKFDIESIFPVPNMEKPRLGGLSSSDILLVYLIREGARRTK